MANPELVLTIQIRRIWPTKVAVWLATLLALKPDRAVALVNVGIRFAQYRVGGRAWETFGARLKWEPDLV